MRLIQWHEKAVDAAGRRPVRRRVHLHDLAHAAAEAVRRLQEGPRQGVPGRQLRLRRQAGRAGHRAGPEGDQRLRHRGHHRQGRQGRLQEGPAAQDLRAPDRRRHHRRRIWIYTGVMSTRTASASTRPTPGSRPTRRTTWPTTGPSPGRPTGGSSTTAPRPTSRASPGARRRSSSGGIRRRRADAGQEGKWVGRDVPDFNAVPGARTPRAATSRSSCARTGGRLLRPAASTGHSPSTTSRSSRPTRNLLSKQQNNPVAKIWKAAGPEERPGAASARRTTRTSSRPTA